MSTNMENSKAKRFKPNPYCEKFKDDIVKEIISLSETGLNSTEKLRQIGILTRVEHCHDCSSAETKKLEAIMKTAPRLAEDKNVSSKSSFDINVKKNVPRILEKVFLSLDYESFKSCFKRRIALRPRWKTEELPKALEALFEEIEKSESNMA